RNQLLLSKELGTNNWHYFEFVELTLIKVKIMLLDFQTTMMLVAVALATALSVITLVHTNIR
ncbi:MAG: hypothetical protein K2M96_03790, partial [Prevotella sp.]|nr:hypothetical protein [Prevotella sp.]